LARLLREGLAKGIARNRKTREEDAMSKIRIPFALAATLAAALMTFVTVVPPPASAQNPDCFARQGTSRDLPVLA
jgi:hypothetical protein